MILILFFLFVVNSASIIAVLWAHKDELGLHDNSTDPDGSNHDSDSGSEHSDNKKVPMVPHLPKDRLQVYLWLEQVTEIISRHHTPAHLKHAVLQRWLPNIRILSDEMPDEFFDLASTHFDAIDQCLITEWNRSKRCWHDYVDASHHSDFDSNHQLFHKICWDVSHNHDPLDVAKPTLIDLTQWKVWNDHEDLHLTALEERWSVPSAQWRLVAAYEAVDSNPHISCVVTHRADARGTENLVRGDFLMICAIMRIRMRLLRFREHRVFPIQVLSILCPRMARILHAHFDWATKCLIIRRSNTIYFDPDEDHHLHNLPSWLLSNPVGDTRLSGTLHGAAAVAPELDGASDEQDHNVDTHDLATESRLAIDLELGTRPNKTIGESVADGAFPRISVADSPAEEKASVVHHRSYSDSQVGLGMRQVWRR